MICAFFSTSAQSSSPIKQNWMGYTLPIRGSGTEIRLQEGIKTSPDAHTIYQTQVLQYIIKNEKVKYWDCFRILYSQFPFQEIIILFCLFFPLVACLIDLASDEVLWHFWPPRIRHRISIICWANQRKVIDLTNVLCSISCVCVFSFRIMFDPSNAPLLDFLPWTGRQWYLWDKCQQATVVERREENSHPICFIYFSFQFFFPFCFYLSL